MAPQQALVNLSPAELSFLRSTLSQTPPIRLDVTKGPRDFRSMRAEYDVLPTANGSARIALEDGTEALVGVKAEVERSRQRPTLGEPEDVDMGDSQETDDTKGKGQNAWVEMSVEVPGFREDDALPVFLSSMLTESLLATLKSEKDEDPLFNDDWDAAVSLYPKQAGTNKTATQLGKPPVIIIAMAVGSNIIFDPAKEELAVADAVLAIACTNSTTSSTGARIVSIRTIDPPSHLTPPGVPNSMNSATGGTAPTSSADALTQRELLATSGVWTPPRGGMKRGLISQVTKMVVENGGVAEEVIGALAAIEVG
ncbi:hypothetical protein CUC08_Gglean007921 [Alternaria sp. MG1]|nr:hypothetical protein CUC08_Gglean007921 [Alternaria sp. MG1]